MFIFNEFSLERISFINLPQAECVIGLMKQINIFTDMKKKEPHIKKPLNAFMIYMKDMRPVVQAECTLKESAAINQLLGRRVSDIKKITFVSTQF